LNQLLRDLKPENANSALEFVAGVPDMNEVGVSWTRNAERDLVEIHPHKLRRWMEF